MIKMFQKPFIQEATEKWMLDKGLRFFIKREDVIHPAISGNKWHKLRYNLLQANKEGHDTLLTFGGAYSNHLYAVAAAGRETGFKTIGVVRGEELAHKPLNPTLSFAAEQGMHLHFVNRDTYRNKKDPNFIATLGDQFGRFYMIPEGGTNPLAIKGAMEILDDSTRSFKVICAAVGTGGTLTGLICAASSHQQVLGFSALKGDFLISEVNDFLKNKVNNLLGHNQPVASWQIETGYHFGGYAKTTAELKSFIETFENRHGIPLDQVYTGKMMFGLYSKMKQGDFREGSSILAIHTGGLQGRRL
ncbi:MAG: pyridoxal-phosphate dependent enzyme [Fulvivirga sp.]|nr:pyridoxal-phosphate dependent enzyme [Fulvivirga sp.]